MFFFNVDTSISWDKFYAIYTSDQRGTTSDILIILNKSQQIIILRWTWIQNSKNNIYGLGYDLFEKQIKKILLDNIENYFIVYL